MSLQHNLNRAARFFTDPFLRFNTFTYLGLYNKLTDEEFIRKSYKVFAGKEIDLDAPVTYNEKLNWLKLYDRRPEYTMMVDKYAVKEFVASRVGAEHVVPALGVWDRFEDIDFDALPDRFVLKCTHDSGGIVICRDKAHFNKQAARRLLERHLKKNYFYVSREWPYKNVQPRILAEPYIDGLGNDDSVEYKVTCFNGEAKLITVCTGKAHDSMNVRFNDFYDRAWETKYPFYVYYKPAKVEPQKPKEHWEIVRICEALAKDIPCVRVDVYVHDGVVYFGEMTFFTWGGFCRFTPEEWDKTLGDWITLPGGGYLTSKITEQIFMIPEVFWLFLLHSLLRSDACTEKQHALAAGTQQE